LLSKEILSAITNQDETRLTQLFLDTYNYFLLSKEMKLFSAKIKNIKLDFYNPLDLKEMPASADQISNELKKYSNFCKKIQFSKLIDHLVRNNDRDQAMFFQRFLITTELPNFDMAILNELKKALLNQHSSARLLVNLLALKEKHSTKYRLFTIDFGLAFRFLQAQIFAPENSQNNIENQKRIINFYIQNVQNELDILYQNASKITKLHLNSVMLKFANFPLQQFLKKEREILVESHYLTPEMFDAIAEILSSIQAHIKTFNISNRSSLLSV